MSTLDKALLFLAACVNVVATADPLHVLPPWAQYVAAVLVAGFAAIGVYTPNPVGKTGSDRFPSTRRSGLLR